MLTDEYCNHAELFGDNSVQFTSRSKTRIPQVKINSFMLFMNLAGEDPVASGPKIEVLVSERWQSVHSEEGRGEKQTEKYIDVFISLESNKSINCEGR